MHYDLFFLNPGPHYYLNNTLISNYGGGSNHGYIYHQDTVNCQSISHFWSVDKGHFYLGTWISCWQKVIGLSFYDGTEQDHYIMDKQNQLVRRIHLYHWWVYRKEHSHIIIEFHRVNNHLHHNYGYFWINIGGYLQWLYWFSYSRWY